MITSHSLQLDDLKKLKSDIILGNKLLNWETKNDMDLSLIKTIKYFYNKNI